MTQMMAPVSDLVYRLEQLTMQPLDDNYVEPLKQRLKPHVLHTAMYAIFMDLKERTKLEVYEEDEKDPQIRLDNMLLAEGVTGPEKDPHPANASQSIDNDDYKVQLHHIRQDFQAQIAQREYDANYFISHTSELMRSQSNLRPLSQLDVTRVVNAIKKKFMFHQIALKQETCETIMALKSKFCDARRKRRNFTKAATEILNDYFDKNIHSPYPTEEVKEHLARQCNISVAQVSNWFGNKRIRFKKNMQKAQEDKEVNDAKRRSSDAAMAMQAAAAAQSMMMPLPGPFMDPSLMGAAPFYFPPYDQMQMLHHPPQPPPQ